MKTFDFEGSELVFLVPAQSKEMRETKKKQKKTDKQKIHIFPKPRDFSSTKEINK